MLGAIRFDAFQEVSALECPSAVILHDDVIGRDIEILGELRVFRERDCNEDATLDVADDRSEEHTSEVQS